ncbi:MAG TPA: TetR/AcrR family transcriptional regulator [Actinophytocola sp.]|uniref:TetR/AcrR family transcriptional regulator n=1 Tax=Actinophytocola sp. TaxID=1872138 RepID=UPI002DB7F375|nr:TetR/AcrR family transcriptional regulator [Actinophytocola sp.]HEU5469433.1 TetR/AcrR family transcriptional regulator [Actinophytocola sp.]
MTPTSKPRLTAAQRSEQLVSAAVTAFAAGGYAGTTTDEVARLAGVSQPYVIRLFGSKQRLFVAAVERAVNRIEQSFREAAENGAADLSDLGAAYDTLLAERDLLAVMLHGYAASIEPAIGMVVRSGFGRIYHLIRELTDASAAEARDFLATGMLLTVLASMQVVGPDAVPPDPWMIELTESLAEDKSDPQPD